MSKNSKKRRSDVWCYDCGVKRNLRIKSHLETYMLGNCDDCGKEAYVTYDRNFIYDDTLDKS